MHKECLEFMTRITKTLDIRDKYVLDVGGRNVNGSIKDLFAGCAGYTTLDHVEGRGVDIVGDLYVWTPPFQMDIVICTEVLEHVVDPRLAMHRMYHWLKPGGVLIMTCATSGRKPHTATGHTLIEGTEPYQNVLPSELELYGDYDIEINAQHKDLYVVWRKPGLAKNGTFGQTL